MTVNSYQLLCNFCSYLIIQDMRVETTLIYKLSLFNSHKLSSNSCSRSTSRTLELRKLSCKLSLISTLINSYATFVLFDQKMMLDKTLAQTLACHLINPILIQLFCPLTGHDNECWEDSELLFNVTNTKQLGSILLLVIIDASSL